MSPHLTDNGMSNKRGDGTKAEEVCEMTLKLDMATSLATRLTIEALDSPVRAQ